MTTIQITCDNCGAKYKLPESFSSPKAKCQKCGSVIDVTAQRAAPSAAAPAAAAAKPAAASATAKPAAAAKPAVDRSKGSGSAAKAERPTARKAHGDDGGGDKPARGRAGKGDRGGAKKANNMPMILGGAGLLVLVVVAVILMQGGDAPAANDTAQNPPTNSAPQAPKAADTPAQKPAETPADKPADKPAEKPPEAKPAEASAPKATNPNDPPWMKLDVKSIDQITDPKSYGEVPFDRLTAEQKTHTQEWAADFLNGGKAGLRAEKAMRDAPYIATFGLVETLRNFDYKKPADIQNAYAIHRFLTEISGGLKTSFFMADLDENVDPRKAEANVRSVKVWLQVFETYKDEAAFLESVKERKAKAAKDEKDGK